MVVYQRVFPRPEEGGSGVVEVGLAAGLFGCVVLLVSFLGWGILETWDDSRNVGWFCPNSNISPT